MVCPGQTQLAHKAHLYLGDSRLECCCLLCPWHCNTLCNCPDWNAFVLLFAALSENSLFFRNVLHPIPPKRNFFICHKACIIFQCFSIKKFLTLRKVERIVQCISLPSGFYTEHICFISCILSVHPSIYSFSYFWGVHFRVSCRY